MQGKDAAGPALHAGGGVGARHANIPTERPTDDGTLLEQRFFAS